ncbi:MAG: hypothetical protein ACFB4J_03055 [Elainellaceae cyanobacterium]
MDSLVNKNSDLSHNNRYYGQIRSQAEKKLGRLQAEQAELEQANAQLKKDNNNIAIAILRDF